MKSNIIFLAAILLLCMASYSQASTITLAKRGIAIDAGSLGEFTLGYPSLISGGSPRSAEVSGNAVDLAYSNGATMRLTLNPTGDVNCELSNLPAGTKNFRVDLSVPESLKGKARWSIDASDAAEFPVKKVDGAFLFKNNAKKFTLNGGQDPADGFTITIPSGWMQLQDNRFWNGHDFAWFTSMDIHATDGKASMSFNISDGTGQPVTVKAAPLNQLSVKLTDNGIVVSNGPAGELTLTFPSLTADNKIIAGSDAALAPDGKSLDLKYPGAATAHLALATKELTITFADLPQGTTAFRMDTKIPLDYSHGGTYSIGGWPAVAFPDEKPANPYLFQDYANNITLVHPAGPDLFIELPPYSYQQLQDNRQWNWDTFAWWMSAPIAPGQTHSAFTLKFEGGNAGKE